MINGIKKNLLLYCLIIWATVSVYIYSRFTVDDAFLTWRYGKNLVEHGIWNYNPTNNDLTQSYTNPIYAILSILPHWIGCDVVLFFKLFSLTVYSLVIWWLMRLSGESRILAILLLGMPATVIHAFSGLETLAYVFLVSLLLIDLHRGDFTRSIIWTLLLFLVRPESWILVLAVPLCWLVSPVRLSSTLPYDLNWRRAILAAFILAIPLAIYFTINYHLFAEILPNTFFAKAKGVFKSHIAIAGCLAMLPLLILLSRRTIGLMIVVTFLFGGMIVSYSTSDLQMNYAARFVFHIFFPAFCFGVYINSANSSLSPRAPEISKHLGSLVINWLKNFRSVTCSPLALIILALIFFHKSGMYPSYCNTYYQRALNSHAVFGKSLKIIAPRYGIRAIAVGDAGMIAYHSGIPVLDTVGLGSRLLTKEGPTDKLYSFYNLDVVIFFTKNGQINSSVFNQDKLYDWVKKQGMKKIGDIFWRDDYALAVYTRQPIPELTDICKGTKVSNFAVTNADLYKMMLSPPWHYWHE